MKTPKEKFIKKSLKDLKEIENDIRNSGSKDKEVTDTIKKLHVGIGIGKVNVNHQFMDAKPKPSIKATDHRYALENRDDYAGVLIRPQKSFKSDPFKTVENEYHIVRVERIGDKAKMGPNNNPSDPPVVLGEGGHILRGFEKAECANRCRG